MKVDVIEETMDLVKVEVLNAVQVFTGGGMNAILDKIESTVRAIPLDPSTASGRDEIRSVAYRVARTKTALDAEGKKLTEEWRKNTALVNAERKKSTERLDSLAEDVRRPLTEFENKEKVRVTAHEEALAEMSGLLAMLQNYHDMDVKLLEEHLVDFSTLHAGREWEEFTDRAKAVRREVSVTLIGRIEARKKFDADQAELARLRAEEARRLQEKRDQELQWEAAEKARIEAERKAQEAADAERKRVEVEAQAERERVAAEAEKVRLAHERIRKEAEDRAAKAEADRRKAEALAEENRLREERTRIEAEKRARDAEEARVAAERKAESDRIAAAKKAAAEKLAAEVRAAGELKAAQEKAKRDSEAAVQREREKVEREQKAADDARLKREADAAHKARIRAEILEDLINSIPASEMVCEEIADQIMAGNLRHVKVAY